MTIIIFVLAYLLIGVVFTVLVEVFEFEEEDEMERLIFVILWPMVLFISISVYILTVLNSLLSKLVDWARELKDNWVQKGYDNDV